MSISEKNGLNKGNEVAISVQGVSKTFKIPHEKISSLRGAFVGAFKKKSFEEFKALDNVSFEVKKGEFFGIIGRNGSGKSTLLKILAGIYQADQGSVVINGLISPFLELGIGFNPELSGRDNIYLNATVLGMTQKQIDEKFDAIVAFSELERFIDQKLKNYSSGMSVRLAFSVSIHANREILLMDEVLAVGDSNFQSKCLDEFNRYKSLGKTVILVSHDIFTIQKHCDRALLMRNGKTIKIGKALDVANEYLEENILDEEARMSEANSSIDVEDDNHNNKEEGAKISKIAMISKIEFSARDNSSVNIFKTGDLIKINIFCDVKKDMVNPIFGVIIRDGGNKNVYALNTQYKKMQTSSILAGKVKITFEIENYFATGTYSVSPAIATDSQKTIDWLDNGALFKVVNPDYTSNAIADFNTKIIISQKNE